MLIHENFIFASPSILFCLPPNSLFWTSSNLKKSWNNGWENGHKPFLNLPVVNVLPHLPFLSLLLLSLHTYTHTQAHTRIPFFCYICSFDRKSKILWHFTPKYFNLLLPWMRTIFYKTAVSLSHLRKYFHNVILYSSQIQTPLSVL